jgi:hypothetical protein
MGTRGCFFEELRRGAIPPLLPYLLMAQVVIKYRDNLSFILRIYSENQSIMSYKNGK